jgi:hypothetical protein
MQSLRFLVSEVRGGWTLTVGRTVLGNHASSEKALRAAFDMARRTGGNNRVFLEHSDGDVEQCWPS